ncbi:MAG: CDP-alcohol phosphatidyltransferase family protein [Christensenellaceae bacterium]|nr:CDP-alcohol phosphatidyltransferase family protein [Christensenellaceae bacterium]MBR3842026.1 CDP-alcohol phosphatidyltransferase family protein [Christensenellaceae bacterium]
MKEKFLNIPNILTLIRLLLIPVVVTLIVDGETIAAFWLFGLACFTDVLDGYIARKYKLQTRLGTWLDPLADKLMAVSVLVTFTLNGIFPVFVIAVVATKELAMMIGGFLVIKNGHTAPANVFGKVAALLLNASIASGFFHEQLYPYYIWATYITLGFVLLAFVQYAFKNGKLCFTKAEDMKEDKKAS